MQARNAPRHPQAQAEAAGLVRAVAALEALEDALRQLGCKTRALVADSEFQPAVFVGARAHGDFSGLGVFHRVVHEVGQGDAGERGVALPCGGRIGAVQIQMVAA